MKHDQILFAALLLFLVVACRQKTDKITYKPQLQRIIDDADVRMDSMPATITAFTTRRSKGGKNDYYSEGTYWWPDPDNPDGPYIRKDGHYNPENFELHKVAKGKMTTNVATLTAAFKITGDKKYAQKAVEHLKVWFVDEETKMNPNLLFSQAIKGRNTGRYIGIIDGIQFIEVARSIEVLKSLDGIDAMTYTQLIQWYSDFNTWLTTSEFGTAERDHGNNHSAWWVAQVGAYSHLLNDNATMAFCRKFYKEDILPEQMDSLGRFTDELTRTKPYLYTLFNLEAFSSICRSLSKPNDNLWLYESPDKRSMSVALRFMVPYIEDKSSWPYPPDVEHFEDMPLRGAALLFGGFAYQNETYIDLWRSLDPNLEPNKNKRDFVIHQPILWLTQEEMDQVFNL